MEKQFIKRLVHNEKIQIFLKTVSGKYLTLNVNKLNSIENIKKIISQREDIPLENIRLVFSGKELKDNQNLYDYYVQS